MTQVYLSLQPRPSNMFAMNSTACSQVFTIEQLHIMGETEGNSPDLAGNVVAFMFITYRTLIDRLVPLGDASKMRMIKPNSSQTGIHPHATGKL